MAVSTNEAMVTSGHKRSGKNKARAKLLVAAIAALVILCALAAGGVFIFKRLHKAPQPTTGSTSQRLTAATVSKDQSVENQAMALSADGNGTDAQKLLDQALAKTSDKTKQAQLYLDKSSVAINVNQGQQALQYAQKAESLNPTRNSAQMIAETAENLGDKATALKYYKLELQRLQADPKSAGPGDIQATQDKIKGLGG